MTQPTINLTRIEFDEGKAKVRFEGIPDKLRITVSTSIEAPSHVPLARQALAKRAWIQCIELLDAWRKEAERKAADPSGYYEHPPRARSMSEVADRLRKDAS